MASPRTRRVLKDLRLKNGNNLCFECGTHNPQWASASYGLWICLECSGKHRSLGVHLSFVRSITMDKWKDSELEKMKAGGNNTSRAFLKGQPDYDPNWTFQEKYNSKAAALLRDKVITEAEGKPWSIETSKARNHVPYVAKMTSNTLKISHSSTIHHSSSSPNFSKGSSSSSGGGGGGGGYNAGGAVLSGSGHGSDDWNMDYGVSKSEISKQKEDFFDRKKSENANRPDDLPPNQGGKYSGFGYSTPKEESQSNQAVDNAVASLSQGWASFSVGASKFLSATKDNAIKFSSVASQRTQETFTKVNEKVHDGKLLTDISAGTKSLASKVAANTQKGWTDLTKMFGDNPSLDDESNKPKTDTPLMGDPVVREQKEKLRSPDTGAADDDWGWGVEEDDWTEDKEAEKKLEADDDEGWGNWGNEGSGGGALIDFGDDDSTPVADTKPKSSSKSTSSKSSKKSSSSKSSSRTSKSSSSTTMSPEPINSGKPISSLEETWDDAGGWDDAAWDEVATDSKKDSKKD